MPVVSITRLRLRAWRFLPSFFLYSFRSARQAERTPGFLGGWLGGSGGNAYWTITVWRDEAAMKAFRDRDTHKAAMPKLLNWCDEASVARVERPEPELPDGDTVFQTLSRQGRTSKVRYPTAEHAAGKTVPDGRAPRIGKRLAPAAM
jgi:Antibiotic biosynthesis monooxygenase